MSSSPARYEAIVIGTSAGGLTALTFLLARLPASYPLPIIAVQHRMKDQNELLEDVLQAKCAIRIVQAGEKEKVLAGRVYIAPPDYHLLMEADRSFSLSADEPVRYSRPSIDVLFETAALVYRQALVGIILTGANNDGAAGISAIQQYGGTTIAQDPAEALHPVMPLAAIRTNAIQHILALREIAEFLINTGQQHGNNT